jgi:hypothetical protein
MALERQIMERIVRKFEGFAAADQADLEYWRARTGEERLAALLDLVLPEDPNEAFIERSARVYPLARVGAGWVPDSEQAGEQSREGLGGRPLA